MGRGMKVVSLWYCWGVMEAQVWLIEALSSSVWSSLVSLIFLLTSQHRFSVGFRSGQFAGQLRPVIPWSVHHFGYVGRCQVLLAKGNHHLHKACQPTEAQSAQKSPGRWLCWLWTWWNTVDQYLQCIAMLVLPTLCFIKVRVKTAIYQGILEHLMLP